ncbi:hypothetical protein KMW28_22860 [Flammeovirga yaeyamensis]|uniref:Lipoprotein n=1 Tax=Flammeovirga yaeyamensis TaxID=367791 RepID=A0AAX1NCI3_9BACT|nr:hypothetical protein [Flammeovirga yaeyamensis]MBB3696795.1 hypothetical protein [Flammeovirga yaeyamensis]NMF33461.1 hypothetical protein [Flammeovirga yaeyamensis]QWG05264.1 hypothetical protein KMW28_22860 [Flammeovirga yaeyamensis]
MSYHQIIFFILIVISVSGCGKIKDDKFFDNKDLNEVFEKVPYLEKLNKEVFKGDNLLKFYEAYDLINNLSLNNVSEELFNKFKDPMSLHYIFKVSDDYLGVIVSFGVKDESEILTEYPSGWVILVLNQQGQITSFLNIIGVSNYYKEEISLEFIDNQFLIKKTYKVRKNGELVPNKVESFKYKISSKGTFDRIN